MIKQNGRPLRANEKLKKGHNYRPVCTCRRCPSHRAKNAGRLLCGSDRNFHVNRCAMDRAACTRNQRITVVRCMSTISTFEPCRVTVRGSMRPWFPRGNAVSHVIRTGDSLTVRCEAEGIPKPIVRWLRDGVAVDEGDANATVRAVGRELIFHSVTSGSVAGEYVCLAFNCASVDYSFRTRPVNPVSTFTANITYVAGELEVA